MFPRWLSWLVVGGLGYLMVTGGAFHHSAPTPKPVAPTATPEATAEKTYPTLDTATDLERWKRAVNPAYAARAHCEYTPPAVTTSTLSLQTIDGHIGEGTPARCAETITVKLTVWSNRATPAYSGSLDLTLGAQELAAGLEASLLGIRPGGERTVILPPDALVHAKKTTMPRALLNALPPGKLAIVTVVREK